MGSQNVICYNLNIFFKSRAQLHVQRFQPLLKENREYFLVPKVLTRVPRAQASRGSWGYGPPWNHEILPILISLNWHFLHFHIIFVVFYSILGLYYYHRNLWIFFTTVNLMFRNREISFTTFTLRPLWKIIINLNYVRKAQMHLADGNTGMGSVILSTFFNVQICREWTRHYRKGKCNMWRFTLRSQFKTILKIGNFFPCFQRLLG